MQDRKNRFSENLSGRRFLLTCFKTVTLRLFGFLFSSPERLLYFARERAKLGPEIALFARAGKYNVSVLISCCQIYMQFEPEFLTNFQNYTRRRCHVTSKFRSNSWTKKSVWYMNLPPKTIFLDKSSTSSCFLSQI